MKSLCPEGEARSSLATSQIARLTKGEFCSLVAGYLTEHDFSQTLLLNRDPVFATSEECQSSYTIQEMPADATTRSAGGGDKAPGLAARRTCEDA